MKLGFFTMPIHPLDKDWRQALQEDREAFVLADELGFVEGLCGEHITDKAENITSCIAFLAWIASATKTMKLGTGTLNLPNIHPATAAAQVAMLDHILDGRFLFGISPGDCSPNDTPCTRAMQNTWAVAPFGSASSITRAIAASGILRPSVASRMRL